MPIRRPPDIPVSEITDQSLFWNRRDFLKATGFGAAAIGGVRSNTCGLVGSDEEKLTPWEERDRVQ